MKPELISYETKIVNNFPLVQSFFYSTCISAICILGSGRTVPGPSPSPLRASAWKAAEITAV